MKREKLIIICVLIIGIAIVWSQLAKQNSIERQAQMKIDQENRVLAIEKAKEDKIAAEKEFNKSMINICIEAADEAYWSYVELNGTGKRDDKEGVWAANNIWNTAKNDKKDAIELCYQKYK